MAKRATRKKTKKTAAPAQVVWDRLSRQYPDATCALKHHDPFELLVATILSAQCTDKRVNMVTPALFRKYPDPSTLAKAKQEDLEDLVRTTGFFRNKAKNLRGAAEKITNDFHGNVPNNMDELLTLPGVARKTANVVLGNAFGVNAGMVVDTHVARLSKRMGLTKHTDPVKIEKDLMKRFPSDQWTMLAHLLIHHGRQVCAARSPKCDNCVLNDACPKVGVKQ